MKPWEVIKAKHGLDSDQKIIARIPNGTEDMELYVVSSEAVTSDQAAKLIPLAPEMYNICKELLFAKTLMSNKRLKILSDIIIRAEGI